MRDFIEYLHDRGGRDLNAEEIADLLWLAAQLPPLGDEDARLNAGNGIDSGQNTEASEPGQGKPNEPEKPALPSQTTDEKRADAYLPGSQREDGAGPGIASLPFRSPGVTALPQRLALGRALRPLKRTAPSPTRLVLDEAATVQRIADERNWLPVLRPARERWLEVVLLADESPSMTVWYELVGELQALLEQSGAFRTVQRWGFYADPERPAEVHFYAGSRFWEGSARYRSPAELNDPRGRRLILLVSDCVSAAWRQPGLNDFLADWKDTPATLVQVLPERLWGRTALRLGREAALRARQPGQPNARLLVKPRRLLDGDRLPAGFPLPVVTLEPETLSLWSQGLTAKGSGWMLGVLFPRQSASPPAPPQPTGERPSPDAQRVLDAFRKTASEEAQRLVRYLSAVPLNLPVMRLVQQVMFDEPRQSHLAEVLLSGLLQRRPGQDRETHPDQVEYDFIEGARDLLRRTAGERELLIVLSRTSAFVDANTGLPVDFPTLLADPSRAGFLHFDDNSLAFASLAVDMLRQMGGRYSHLADYWSEKIKVQIRLSQNAKASDPWVDIKKRYQIGKSILGTVIKVEDFGAFVHIEPGVEGLILLNEFAQIDGIEPLNTIVRGDRVIAKIVSVDTSRQLVNLSMRQADLHPDDIAEFLSSKAEESDEKSNIQRVPVVTKYTRNEIVTGQSASISLLQPKEFFIGRNWEIEIFGDILFNRVPKQILNIYGPTGIGKSTLAIQMSMYAKESGVPFAFVDGNHPALTPDRMLFLFSEGLQQSQAGEHLESSLRPFDRLIREYLTIAQVLQTGGGVQALFDPIGNLKDPTGFASILAGLGNAMTESIKRIVSNRFALERYLRGADRTLTAAFVEGLQVGTEETGQPVALIIDTYEALEGLDDWVYRFFTPALPAQARLVILGNNRLSKVNFDWTEYEEKMETLYLPELAEADAKAYLQHFGLSDPTALEQVYRYAGGYPLLLVLVRQLASEVGGWQALGTLESEADRDRIATQLLERILREERVQDVQAFMEKGAIARWFDPETVRVILEVDLQEARAVYDKLARHSFVERHPYGLKFHDKIRELLLARLKFTSSSEHARLHQRLMDYYAEKAGIQSPAPKPTKYTINIYGPSHGLVIGNLGEIDEDLEGQDNDDV